MKTLWTLIMVPFLSWAQPVASQSANHDISAYQLVKAFDGKVAGQMPQSLKKVKIQNLKLHKDSLSFQIQGAKFVLTVLSKREHSLSFNGKLFKSDEISDAKLARQSLLKKFGLRKKQVSWFSYLIQRAWANTPLDPTQGAVEEAFYSYQFLPESQPLNAMSTSLSELPKLIGKSNTRDALSILGSLLTAVSAFAQTHPGLNQALDLGVPGNSLPIAPNFSTSSRVVR